MPLTNAERQRIRRERHRGEPRANNASLTQLATLQTRVAQLEAELAARPQQAPRKPPGRAQDAVAALRQKRDDLAERLAQIEAYDPTIEAKAAAWIARVDAPPRRRR